MSGLVPSEEDVIQATLVRAKLAYDNSKRQSKKDKALSFLHAQRGEIDLNSPVFLALDLTNIEIVEVLNAFEQNPIPNRLTVDNSPTKSGGNILLSDSLVRLDSSDISPKLVKDFQAQSNQLGADAIEFSRIIGEQARYTITSMFLSTYSYYNMTEEVAKN